MGSKLAEVPQQARADVDKELAFLDQQIPRRTNDDPLAAGQGTGRGLRPERDPRSAEGEAGRGHRPRQDRLQERGRRSRTRSTLWPPAPRSPRTSQNNAGGQNGNGQQQNNNGGQQGGQQGGGQQGGGASAASGPVAADFVDITTLQPNVPQKPGSGGNALTGTFTSSCGVNANKKFNTDNVIVAPGVTNGAHHLHDYVGNQSNDAFATNDDLAKAATTCQNQGDKSTYYWPVLRVQDGTQEFNADKKTGAAWRATSERSCRRSRRRSSSSATRRARSSRCRRSCASSRATRRRSPTAPRTPTPTGAAPASRTRCS